MSKKAKELIFEEEARDALRKGIKQLTELVGVTLGPRGHHVGMEGSWGPPKITSDGHTIAESMEVKDPYINMGVSIGKEVAQKMKDKCGDGTTSSLLLLGALVEHGVKNIASGACPILVKRGMEKAVEHIVSLLEKQKLDVQKEKEIQDIATAAASGNQEVGALIAQAFQKVGRAGVISIEEAQGTETVIDLVEGMELDRGYVSSYFCTNAEKMTCEMNAPKVLITDKKISSVQEILPLLQAVAASGQELLLIADDIEGDALSTLVVNKLRGTLKICAIKAPGFGDRRKALLQDIAVLTGATVISDETSTSWKEATSEVFGSVEKVTITKDHTTLIHGGGDSKMIRKRIQQIEAESQQTSQAYDQKHLQERAAKLSGGVAVLRVGAPTEPAMKQLKQLFEDSLSSTKAAIAEGIVVGGGIALLRAAKEAATTLSLPSEEMVGAKIVIAACEAPFRKLVENCGCESSVFLQEVLAQKGSIGFNALTEQVEDLLKAGVRDPLKVVKSALQFALSAAGTILLAECLIGEASEDEAL